MFTSGLYLDFDGRRLEIRRNKRRGRKAYLTNKGLLGCYKCCLYERYCKEMGHHNNSICRELMIKGAEHFEDEPKFHHKG